MSFFPHTQVLKDPFNHLRLTDEINNPNLLLKVGTNQGVCFVELSLEVQSDRVGVVPESAQLGLSPSGLGGSVVPSSFFCL